MTDMFNQIIQYCDLNFDTSKKISDCVVSEFILYCVHY